MAWGKISWVSEHDSNFIFKLLLCHFAIWALINANNANNVKQIILLLTKEEYTMPLNVED